MDILSRASILPGTFMPKLKPTTSGTPATMGFSMPAEWARHEATWLAWPHNPTDWPGQLDAVRWVYGEIVRHANRGEIVRMLVRGPADLRQARSYLRRAGADLSKVQFINHPTNRGWTRDSGPVFVKRTRPKSETAIVHFHFNAWAKYADWHKDRRVPETAVRLLSKWMFNAECNRREIIIEGRSIEPNVRGTLLTTEECSLHPKGH